MDISWKALVFLGAAGVLSIATVPVRAQDEGSGERREVEVTVSDETPASPGGEEREIEVTLDGDLPLPSCDRRFTVALGEPGKQASKTKRIVITTKGDEDRPRLGVVLRFEKSDKTDPKGAFVEAVTPGSPADEAGVKVGDIITKFNGQPLGASPHAENDQSAPASRLVDMARKLGEGEKVSLDILRGDKTLNLDVVARKLEGKSVFTWNGDGGEDFDFSKFVEGDPSPFNFCFGGEEWLDMELVSLNPDLGEYFGTTEGLLVVKAPESPLGIKSGDILLKIGDRKATNPSQAFRVLGSYDAGEKVTLEILRKQKNQTLQVTIPEGEEGGGPHSRIIKVPRPQAPVPPPQPAGDRRG